MGTDGVNRIQVYSRDAQLMYAGVSSTSGVKYIYLGNHILAEVSAGGVQYNHTDGLGSPVARTDGNRAIVGGYTRYEPYGLIAAGPAGTLGFTGHVNATDVGLVYMQQRYYDPVAGRFLSIDPVTTDMNDGSYFSRYSYGSDNPYKYVDPDGRNALIKLMQALAKILVKAERQAAKGTAQEVTKQGAKEGVNAANEGGRAANKLRPIDSANGPHSTFKRDADGQITNTATYEPNPKNPSGFDEVKRVDVTGKPHTNTDGTKVATPHVHESGNKNVRPAKPEELPTNGNIER